jgi:antitoxin ParD1/3/4
LKQQGREGSSSFLKKRTKKLLFVDRLCQSLPYRVATRWMMATMNVSLPESMKDWVEAQAKGGRYGNASDYVRDLIRRDQERQDKIAQLQRLIDDGLGSGVSARTMEALLAEARARAAAGPDGL